VTQETTTDWRTAITQALEKRHEKTARKGPAVHPGAFRRSLHPMNFNTSFEFLGLLHKAAEQRDVNTSTYVRRAVALLIAHDLDMPIHQVVWETPCPGRWGRIQNSPGERDLGEDIHNWCPHPDCDGEHLSLR
jgi:hypothetical protein